MAQSLKTVKTRIHSVESIKKTTRAMEMVSSARLRILQKQLSVQEDYFSKIKNVLNNLLASSDEIQHVLLKPRQNKKSLLLCVITSDTGLCANYNSAVIRLAEDFIRQNKSYNVNLITVGRKGHSHFRKKRFAITSAWTELFGRYSQELSDKISDKLLQMFLSGESDEVYIAYTDFISALRHKPVLEKILNVERTEAEKIEYLTEPDISVILDKLIPAYIINKIRRILLSAFTAEHAIRVMVMHEATGNALDLLEELTTLRNKMRQADITREIVEVISSAEALKG